LEIAILTLQMAWLQRDHRSTRAANGFEDSFRSVDLQIAADDRAPQAKIKAASRSRQHATW
jgi:hypothetical protein